MADVRLKTITIDPITSQLIIQNGIINITNTDISSDVLTASVILDGGLSLNCFQDASSSTSGGTLTIGGGTAIQGQTYLGSNLILDNNSSILSVQGSSDYRLFLDTIANKHFYITPDGINRRFDLYDTTLTINLTKSSTNASIGALVINGGISINCTTNSVNGSNGGALTIGGGLAVGGNVFLSKSLTIGQNYSNNFGLLINYTGNSQLILQTSSGSNNCTFNMNNDNLIVSNNNNITFNTTIGNFIVNNNQNSFTITSTNFIFNKPLLITDTTQSINSNNSSLITYGGININSTLDASSFTQGGGLTILGGLAIAKKIYTNDSLGIELSNTNKNNKLMLYQVNSDLTQTNLFTGFGITQGSMRLQVNSINSDYIFYSCNNTLGNSSNEVFRIKGTNEVRFIGNNQQYSILGGGNTINDLSIQGQNTSTGSNICYFTYDGNGINNNYISIFGLGTPNNVTNSEYLTMGWNYNNNSSNGNYIISTNYSGSGSNRSLLLQTANWINNTSNVSNLNGQLNTSTDTNIYINSTNASISSSSGALVLNYGGLSINNTMDASSSSQGGSLTLAGGMSVMKSIFIGNSINISNSNSNLIIFNQTNGSSVFTNSIDSFTFSGNNQSTTYNLSFNLFSLNNNINTSTVGNINYELFSISTTNTSGSGIYSINSNANGSGILRPISLSVGNSNGNGNTVFLSTNGNVYINGNDNGNGSAGNYQLNVNQNAGGNGLYSNGFNSLNSLTIYNTNDSTSISSSGSLTILGGTSISKSLYVGGLVSFLNTTNAYSTSASVYVSGGLTINGNQSGTFGNGSLTVNGSASFGSNVYFNQSINLLGNLNGNNINAIFNSINLSSTQASINLSTGSLITFGGISINNTTNAISITNGGSITIGGGLSIFKDTYLGGNMYNYGTNVIYTNNANTGTNGNLVQVYDISNFKAFSLDSNSNTSDLSISRYNNSGNFIEKSIDISRNTGIISLNNTYESLNASSGSFITNGGITILCTTDSTNDFGGALTVYGGTNVMKSLYVGGDVTFLSTTISNNYNNGSVVINGGIGLIGNLNILGNTVLNGSLTVTGTISNINTTNTLITDNIIILHAGPSGTADAGFMTQRYQVDNDSGLGDVVNDPNNFMIILPNQSGMTTIQIKFPISSSSSDNYYNNWWIKITTGFSAGQVRQITGYIGSTRIATIDNAFTNQNPSLGDNVQLYDRPYTGLIWSESNDRFEFGTTVQNPGEVTVSFTEYVPIFADSATFNSTISSSSSTIGALVLSGGGLSINCSLDSTSISSGNALTITGGASIGKTLYVGNTIYIDGINIQPNTYDLPSTTIFNASNNVNNVNIPELNFPNTVWGITIYISIQLIANVNMYCNYTIMGVNQGSMWEITQTGVGDTIVDFNITNGGQIQYSCQNYAGFTSLTFKFKCITN